MVKLIQNRVTGYFTRSVLRTEDEIIVSNLTNVHPSSACDGRGCAIHDHPSNHPLKNAPLNWREDRNILERICTHGVGHPDFDSAQYLHAIGREAENIHGCDGCCGVAQD